jgi:type IV secretion system protein VirD4
VTKWNEFKTKILMLSKGEKLVLLFCFSFIISLFPAGCIAKVFVGEWDAGVLRGFVLALTTGYGIVTALVFACAITFVIIRFSVNNTDLNATKEVDDRGVATSMAGTYGTARWMNETEAKKVYEVGPVENVTGTILGQFTQDGEEVIALPFEPTGNRNLILIGPPGSGKSFGYVRTAVFQSIVRGESVVVTDPKGEIHNDMRKLLESRGYKVKVFNLINLDLSNAWDCVQEIYDPITGNIDDQRVITFCKTVIANTGGGANSKGDPFWESSEENLFRVAVSYCAYIREKSLIEIYERRAKELLTQLPYITQEDEQSLIEIVKNPESAMVDRRRVVEYLAHSFYGDEEGDRKLSEWEEDAPTCNISDIYDALLHNDLDKWEANFKYVPLSHPAASAWAVFKGMGERVQPNIVGGLNTRLQLFMTYKVRRVISNDDIRLANLGAEKTALFLIISDDNASMQLLSSLLLSFLFKDLKEAFDAVGGEGRIPVNVVADELANTGVWPNFEKTIATARSRKIAVSLILQSLPQLTQLYGEENAETIIGCCNTMLVLGCNDKYTAEYISDKSGIVTIRAKSVSDTRASSAGNRGVMQGYSLSEGDGKRNLVNPDEVQHLDKEQILIMTNGQNMLEAKRFGFIHHPLFNDPHFVPTKWAELPKTADLYPNARKHDAIESRESSFGDIQRQKEINTDITQKRSEERMKPRLSKKDLLATDEPAPKKKNAFKK